MTKPSDYAHLFPIVVAVKQGKTYWWCGCGASKTQPFCDRTDCGTQALPFVAPLSEELSFCQCKRTKTPPLCDGSHAQVLLELLKKSKNST